MSELIRVTKRAKQMLEIKKENTGKSMAELVEYAVFNMPFIPPKNMGNNRNGRGF